jgi:hypothetical protein
MGLLQVVTSENTSGLAMTRAAPLHQSEQRSFQARGLAVKVIPSIDLFRSSRLTQRVMYGAAEHFAATEAMMLGRGFAPTLRRSDPLRTASRMITMRPSSRNSLSLRRGAPAGQYNDYACPYGEPDRGWTG